MLLFITYIVVGHFKNNFCLDWFYTLIIALLSLAGVSAVNPRLKHQMNNDDNDDNDDNVGDDDAVNM